VLTWVRARRAATLTALTVRAWIALIAFDLLVRAGFAQVHQRIRRCRVKGDWSQSRPDVDDIVWAVDEACVWYIKRAACLQRSAVTTWMLRRHGIRAELVIGYRPVPFESHAWVEVAGMVVNDRQQYQTFFAVLERL
jgi:hypothetical protein